MSSQDDKRLGMPITLSKTSLRERLEAYYSLVAPDHIADVDWKEKFEKIFNKFGGTHEGEKALATKLSRKYGTDVRLLLSESSSASAPISKEISTFTKRKDEAYYMLNPSQLGSNVLDTSSPVFDPMAFLRAPRSDVEKVNSYLSEGSQLLLDHTDKFRSLLPECDPLRREPSHHSHHSSGQRVKEAQRVKQPSPFSRLAESYSSGPLSVLHKAFTQRRRVRVVLRYLNGIRGVITGYLLAFDKHMNIILRDVEDVFSDRDSSRDRSTTLAHRELIRRRTAVKYGSHQVHRKQRMVRGDNIVLVYLAENERSAYPKTSKSPVSSQYRSRQGGGEASGSSPGDPVGTPGSLQFAHQRQQKRRS